jgi:hypothetical protein
MQAWYDEQARIALLSCCELQNRITGTETYLWMNLLENVLQNLAVDGDPVWLQYPRSTGPQLQ